MDALRWLYGTSVTRGRWLTPRQGAHCCPDAPAVARSWAQAWAGGGDGGGRETSAEVLERTSQLEPGFWKKEGDVDPADSELLE